MLTRFCTQEKYTLLLDYKIRGVRNGEYYSLNIFGIPREYMSNNIHFKLKKIL